MAADPVLLPGCVKQSSEAVSREVKGTGLGFSASAVTSTFRVACAGHHVQRSTLEFGLALIESLGSNLGTVPRGHLV